MGVGVMYNNRSWRRVRKEGMREEGKESGGIQHNRIQTAYNSALSKLISRYLAGTINLC